MGTNFAMQNEVIFFPPSPSSSVASISGIVTAYPLKCIMPHDRYVVWNELLSLFKPFLLDQEESLKNEAQCESFLNVSLRPGVSSVSM